MICSISERRARAFGWRSSGFTAIIFSTSCSTERESVRRQSRGEGRGEWRCFLTTESGERPLKGRRPVSIVKSIAPSE